MSKEYESLVEIFRGPSIDIFYHSQDAYFEINYKGGITKSEEYRKANEEALVFAVEHQVKKWFIDQKEMNIHPNDQKWFFEEWQPNLDKKLGKGRKTAIILSKNLYGEFTIKQENQKLLDKNDQETMLVTFFKDRKEALDWLLS